MRNVLIAIGNAGRPVAACRAAGAVADADPVVAEAARWASLVCRTGTLKRSWRESA